MTGNDQHYLCDIIVVSAKIFINCRNLSFNLGSRWIDFKSSTRHLMFVAFLSPYCWQGRDHKFSLQSLLYLSHSWVVFVEYMSAFEYTVNLNLYFTIVQAFLSSICYKIHVNFCNNIACPSVHPWFLKTTASPTSLTSTLVGMFVLEILLSLNLFSHRFQLLLIMAVFLWLQEHLLLYLYAYKTIGNYQFCILWLEFYDCAIH